MTITHDMKVGLIVFIGAGVLFWLTQGSGTNRKPLSSKEGDLKQQKKDAETVFNAYKKAIIAGEPPSALEELNRITEKKYGLRCYKKPSDGKYYVMDTKGNDIKY